MDSGLKKLRIEAVKAKSLTSDDIKVQSNCWRIAVICVDNKLCFQFVDG